MAACSAAAGLRISILLASLLAMSACVHRPTQPPPAGADAAPVPALFETQRAIDAYIDSGRYQADFAAVVQEAREWLERRAPRVKNPAIVVDVDETSLSNWPAFRVNGWARIVHGDCDLETGPCNVHTWQGMGRSEALPATLALVRRARQLGVAVFFVTGRPQALQAPTERNLREQGFTFTRVILKPEGSFRSAVDFKAPARCGIQGEGYVILLTIGDQQSDIDGGCAERGFKLPNPVYFLP